MPKTYWILNRYEMIAKTIWPVLTHCNKNFLIAHHIKNYLNIMRLHWHLTKLTSFNFFLDLPYFYFLPWIKPSPNKNKFFAAEKKKDFFIVIFLKGTFWLFHLGHSPSFLQKLLPCNSKFLCGSRREAHYHLLPGMEADRQKLIFRKNEALRFNKVRQ